MCVDKGATEREGTSGSQGQEMSVWDACVAAEKTLQTGLARHQVFLIWREDFY